MRGDLFSRRASALRLSLIAAARSLNRRDAARVAAKIHAQLTIKTNSFCRRNIFISTKPSLITNTNLKVEL